MLDDNPGLADSPARVARLGRVEPRWGFTEPAGSSRLAAQMSEAVTIHVPGVLRGYCGGARQLSLAVSTVRAALEELERSQPSLHRNVCDETGAVRRHVNLFVNRSHVRDLEGLDTALRPGDVVSIIPAVSGG